MSIPSHLIEALSTLEPANRNKVTSYLEPLSELFSEWETVKKTTGAKGSLTDYLTSLKAKSEESVIALTTAQKELEAKATKLEKQVKDYEKKIAENEESLSLVRLTNKKNEWLGSLPSTFDSERFKTAYDPLLTYSLNDKEELLIQGKPAEEFYKETIQPIEGGFIKNSGNNPRNTPPNTPDPDPQKTTSAWASTFKPPTLADVKS